MISTISKMEVKIGERKYQLLCASDSPLGEVYDALSSMKGFVITKMQEIDKCPQDQNKEEKNDG